MKISRVIDPTRIRTHEESFAYIPHRFLRGGFYSRCMPTELCVYMLLVLAADAQGVSFYGRERMSALTRFSLDRIEEALGGLERKGLIACNGVFAQVLSLPEGPSATVDKRRTDGGAMSVSEAMHAYVLHLKDRGCKEGT